MNRKPFYQQLYFWVFIGMLAGVAVGYFFPSAGLRLKPLGDGFIRLIRMVVAPIIFTTVVVGMAGMGSLKRIGRIGLKSFVYFEVMTTFALVIGWLVVTVFQPGAGMNADLGKYDVTQVQQKIGPSPAHQTVAEFLLNIIPKTVVGAFAEGEILQVLFFSVLFGIAMATVGESNRPVIYALEQISKALMHMIAMIIKLAPLAVFGAMSFTVASFGLKSLKHLAQLMACMYGSCFFFVIICLGLLLRLNGLSIWKFLRYLRDELFIVFGTGSSESVFPRLMTKMENLGCSKPLVGLVLPSGYSFNLDGTSIYLTMGAIFIAQALNIHLTFGQELTILLVCLVTSKGAAAVVGSAFITLAATLSSLHQVVDGKTVPLLPVEGMVLILGVDWFMAQARAMTNMVGNGVATVVIAKWEKEFDAGTAERVLNESPADFDLNKPPAT